MNTKLLNILRVIAVLLIGGFIHTCLSLYYVDKHEFGFTYDQFTGEIAPVERQGWVYKSWPKYDVRTIDCRPYQVRITASISIGDRILNAKLVRFNPKGIDEFISWHGRDAGDDVKNLQEIFKCYAFAPDSGASCPFIEVINETAPVSRPE